MVDHRSPPPQRTPSANPWATAVGAMLALGLLLLLLPPVIEDRLRLDVTVRQPLADAGVAALATGGVLLAVSLALQLHRRWR